MVHPNGSFTTEWDNAIPGTCCRPHFNFVNFLNNLIASATTIYGLEAAKGGFGWSATRPNPATDIPTCAGLRMFGPCESAFDREYGKDVYNPSGEDASVEGTL